MQTLIKMLVWPIVIIAIALLVVGLIAVTAPNMTISTLVLYFGVIMMIIGGLQMLISFLLRNKVKEWIALFLLAAVFVYVGIYSFYKVDTAAVYFEIAMAVWALLTGVAQIIVAFRNKGARIFLYSMGILSIIISAIMYFSENTTNLQFLFGFYMLLLSFSLFFLSYKLLVWKRNQPVETNTQA
jgi:uncharacterized membrane protein HdeD (DUF308 family)